MASQSTSSRRVFEKPVRFGAACAGFMLMRMGRFREMWDEVSGLMKLTGNSRLLTHLYLPLLSFYVGFK